jgi:hypothetical protein
MLEVVPDYSRLEYTWEDQITRRYRVILTILMTLVIFGIPVAEHFIYGRWKEAEPETRTETGADRWLPSWLRILRGDIYANYTAIGVVMIYPFFIYGLLFLDDEEWVFNYESLPQLYLSAALFRIPSTRITGSRAV